MAGRTWQQHADRIDSASLLRSLVVTTASPTTLNCHVACYPLERESAELGAASGLLTAPVVNNALQVTMAIVECGHTARGTNGDVIGVSLVSLQQLEAAVSSRG